MKYAVCTALVLALFSGNAIAANKTDLIQNSRIDALEAALTALQGQVDALTPDPLVDGHGYCLVEHVRVYFSSTLGPAFSIYRVNRGVLTFTAADYEIAWLSNNEIQVDEDTGLVTRRNLPNFNPNPATGTYIQAGNTLTMTPPILDAFTLHVSDDGSMLTGTWEGVIVDQFPDDIGAIRTWQIVRDSNCEP